MSYRRSGKPPFSTWLVAERARHNLKAGEVAKRLREMGFPAEESTYRTWEAGRRPAPDTVAALERLFASASPSADAPGQGDVAAAIRDQIVVQQHLADAAVEANRIALEQLEATREQTATLRAMLMQSLSPDEETRARLLPLVTQWLRTTPTPSPGPAAPRPSRAR